MNGNYDIAYQEWEMTISDLKRFSVRRLESAILSINFALPPWDNLMRFNMKIDLSLSRQTFRL